MKRNFIALVIILGIIMVMGSSPAFSKTFARVNGSVETKEGKPIPGAKVILIFSEDQSKHEIATDEKGKWSKVDIPPGMWTIGFMADGYQSYEIVNVNFSAIKANPPIDVILTPIPKNPFSEGDTLYRQGKYAEALEAYQGALSESKDLSLAYEKIGLCYYRLDNFDKAIEAFKTVLGKNPGSRDVLVNLSAIYLEKGNLEEGLNYFKQLDEGSITDPNIFYNFGVILFGKDQGDLAIEYFKKALSRDANFVKGYNQLALVYLNKGELEEAKKNFREVIRLDPQSEMAAQAGEILKSLE